MGGPYRKGKVNVMQSVVKDGYKVLYEMFYLGTPIALIDRGETRGDRYVVAWNYDSSDGTWGQGHYFEYKAQAENYIEKHYNTDLHTGC